MAVGDILSSSNVVENTTQNNAVNQANNNTYTAGQQSLQNQALTGLSGILNGSVDTSQISNAINKPAYDYALQLWNQTGAHQLAAQYGAASPTIDAARQQLLLGIAAQQGNNATANTLNAYNMASQYAFTPTGTTQNRNDSQALNSTQKTNNTNWGSLAATALDVLAPATF